MIQEDEKTQIGLFQLCEPSPTLLLGGKQDENHLFF